MWAKQKLAVFSGFVPTNTLVVSDGPTPGLSAIRNLSRNGVLGSNRPDSYEWSPSPKTGAARYWGNIAITLIGGFLEVGLRLGSSEKKARKYGSAS